MQEQQVKIGDVVAWDKVPSGALVCVQEERHKSFWLRTDHESGFQIGFMLRYRSLRSSAPRVAPARSRHVR